MFFRVVLFQYCLPSDMAARTVQYNLAFEVFLEIVAFWCFVIRLIDTGGSGDPSPSLCCSRERTCCFSLLFYGQNLLLLSAALEKTRCFSLLLYRQNLLLLSATVQTEPAASLSSTLQTEPAASLCYSRYRTCCISLFYYTDRTCCFSLLL